ncbi:MAG TPA: glycosyltransferase family 2 protein [Pyrinomonadaceae bacterium]|jgi:GT2 family glycosyltransferase|nr:glycosyltransferase family 2 protein [Pyrinomonadaceae bacterium]
MTRIPDVSVIIVNWNSLELTSSAIRSLQEQTKDIDFEVILVDNGSTRDSSAVELELRFPEVTMIKNPDNRGFSKACNQGLAVARGEYLLLLNSDTLQIENALDKAVKYMKQYTDIGVLGIRHLNNDPARSLQASVSEFPDPWAEVLNILGWSGAGASISESSPSEARDVDWVCGSFLMMRRHCLANTGSLDERYFVYDEDIDWCLRAKKAGWRVHFWPGTCLIHLGAASNLLMKDKTFAHFRSRLTYIRRHHSLFSAGAYYLAVGLRLTGATAIQVWRYIFGMNSSSDVRERYERQRRFLFLRSTRSGC